MGMALARGWLGAGLAPSALTLVDPAASDGAKAFALDHGVRLIDRVSAPPPRVLVIAVKPQIIDKVYPGIRAVAGPETVVVSIAAGIAIAALAKGCGTDRVIRTMPNTPAQVGKGITGIVAGPGATEKDRAIAEALLGASGRVVELGDEAEIDALTAVSGSGPAYVFHLVEAMAAAGEAEGLSAEQAMALARQTVVGAAALMEEDDSPASVLRQNVTSPGGTTAAALEVLMAEDGLTALMKRAVAAARKRSEELGR